MQDYNFSYDKENDDLFVFNKESKSKGSIEIGDIILDFNNKRELVGIEMMNASSMIKDLTNENMIKDILGTLKKCSLHVIKKKNMLIIHLKLISQVKELRPILSVPQIEESSPALMC